MSESTVQPSRSESEPDDDCCEACAEARAEAHASVPELITVGSRRTSFPVTIPEQPPVRIGTDLPVLEPGGKTGVGISRSQDRRITFGGLAVAGGFLALAAGSLLLPATLRLGSWLPVHLVLAGAAATAIASVLPFFSGAMSVSPPARPAIRILGIGLVAAGAATATAALSLGVGGGALPAAAAAIFVVGVGCVGVAIFGPLGSARGPRRRLLEAANAVALLNVGTGVTLVILDLGGNVAARSAWGYLKPAHAWLNLIGFASLVIVATLVHLAPTIVGTRMRPRLSSRLAVIGLAIGAPLVALGFVSGIDLVARIGAFVALAGAAGIAGHASIVHQDPERGRWTTDLAWHRLTATALLAGQAWMAIGIAMAAVPILWLGADPTAWSLARIAGPLVIGGVAQVLIAAMSHLLPAIGPGDIAAHARQRRLLGIGSWQRLTALNVGVLLVTVAVLPIDGIVSRNPQVGQILVPFGLVLVGASLAATLALLVRALRSSALRRVPFRPGLS